MGCCSCLSLAATSWNNCASTWGLEGLDSAGLYSGLGRKCCWVSCSLAAKSWSSGWETSIRSMLEVDEDEVGVDWGVVGFIMFFVLFSESVMDSENVGNSVLSKIASFFEISDWPGISLILEFLILAKSARVTAGAVEADFSRFVDEFRWFFGSDFAVEVSGLGPKVDDFPESFSSKVSTIFVVATVDGFWGELLELVLDKFGKVVDSAERIFVRVNSPDGFPWFLFLSVFISSKFLPPRANSSPVDSSSFSRFTNSYSSSYWNRLVPRVKARQPGRERHESREKRKNKIDFLLLINCSIKIIRNFF